jgi:HNH endonuclease
MAISPNTIKRLFAKSQDQCAMPRCTSPLTIGDSILGEVCHIRARRKRGPRYDATLSTADIDQFHNLVLLCPTCHTLVDKDPRTYSAELLQDIKELHERNAPCEITPDLGRQALLILAKHEAKRTPTVMRSPVSTKASVSASQGGVAISVGGHNLGAINVTAHPKKPAISRYPANSIGADANLTNYIEYLCQLYVDYMSPTGLTTDELWIRIGRAIKSRFRLRKRTRNHLSAERFPALVDYLINEKLARTPVGMKHCSRGTRLCRSFDEFRFGHM